MLLDDLSSALSPSADVADKPGLDTRSASIDAGTLDEIENTGTTSDAAAAGDAVGPGDAGTPPDAAQDVVIPAPCKTTPPTATSPRSPRTVGIAPFGGTSAWVSLAEAKVPDGKVATCSMPTRGGSRAIELVDFGFPLPVGAIILGVSVEITRHAVAGAEDDLVQLVLGTTVSDDLGTGVDWPTAPTAKTYGGPTMLWGTPWTREQVISPSFGVRLAVKGDITEPSIANVDGVRVVVHYCQ